MKPDPQTIAIRVSLAVAVLMLVGKISAAWLTGSSAILSDAAESVIHIAATGIAAFSLWYSARPPDPQHPYGHGKIAYFSAGLEGALISIAALSILVIAIEDLIVGPEVRELGVGIAIIGALGLVNLALGLSLVKIGKRTNALVLVANGQHVLTDMWTSLAVVGGVALVWLTDIVWLDPIVALLAGLQILYTSFKLLKRSFEGLMEKADPEDTQRLIGVLEAAQAEGTISSFHQLHHRRLNDRLWLEVHLLMPSALSLLEAHARASKVEAAINTIFAPTAVQITSHLEPEDHDLEHPDDHAGLVDPFEAERKICRTTP